MHDMMVGLLAYTAEWGTIVVAPDNATGGMHHASDRP
jgi:hypothetical protein